MQRTTKVSIAAGITGDVTRAPAGSGSGGGRSPTSASPSSSGGGAPSTPVAQPAAPIAMSLSRSLRVRASRSGFDAILVASARRRVAQRPRALFQLAISPVKKNPLTCGRGARAVPAAGNRAAVVVAANHLAPGGRRDVLRRALPAAKDLRIALGELGDGGVHRDFQARAIL